jgi:oxalate decarboxylase/phosphoglucose isomerase-like protein (cupin superfamily)
MKTKLFIAFTILFMTNSCVTKSSSENSENENGFVTFENGDLMTAVSIDPMGNEFKYPSGDAAITSQVKVWKTGFQSPWHYHPYTGVAYVLQGELTVNFDTEANLEDNSVEKTVNTTQTFKAGDKAFLGVSNTWHYSENLGDEDLIFMVTWLGEKDKPIAVMQ